jgi:peptidoglycan/LPS O-acetylase OafA/YrhL
MASPGLHDDYVVEVNSLRCFAMMAVMLVHSGVLPFGAWGVWVFFVISGFAITRSLLMSGGSIGNFYLKRALRILPLYFFYLAVVGVYAATTGRTGYTESLPNLMTFTYNLALSFGVPAAASAVGVPHLWSISGEEQFYIAFPFLFVFLPRRQFVACMVAIILVCPVLRWVLSVTYEGTDPVALSDRVRFFTPAHFDAFAVGALISVATFRRIVSARIGGWCLAAGMAALVLYFGVYAWLQHGSLRNILSGHVAGQWREVFAYTAVWMASAGLLMAVIAKLPVVMWAVRPQVFKEIGKISYGGYVYHGLAIELVFAFTSLRNDGGILSRLAFFGCLFGMSMVAAWASYRWLEKPFLKLKDSGWGLPGAAGSDVECFHTDAGQPATARRRWQ